MKNKKNLEEEGELISEEEGRGRFQKDHFSKVLLVNETYRSNIDLPYLARLQRESFQLCYTYEEEIAL